MVQELLCVLRGHGIGICNKQQTNMHLVKDVVFVMLHQNVFSNQAAVGVIVVVTGVLVTVVHHAVLYH